MHITFSPLFIIWHRKELRQKLYHSTQHFCLRRLDSKVQVPQIRWEDQVKTAGLWSSLVPSAKYFPTILLTKSGMYFRVPVPKRLKTLVQLHRKSNYISSAIIVQNGKSCWFYTIWRKKDTHQLMHNCAFMHNCYSAGAYMHRHCRASI